MNAGDMPMSGAEMFAMGLWGGVLGLVMLALGIWLHWRILERMGYQGAWSLLLLLFAVPMLGMLAGPLYLVALWTLAFTRWPRERGALPATAAPAPPPPAPPPPDPLP